MSEYREGDGSSDDEHGPYVAPPNGARLSCGATFEHAQTYDSSNRRRRQLQALVRQHAGRQLRVPNAFQCLRGPVSILRSHLNSDGASDRVETSRKAAHTDQILDPLARSDIPYLLGVQGCFRQGEEDSICGPKHSYELVVQEALHAA